MTNLIPQGEKMNQPNFDPDSIVPSVLKVTASSDFDISDDLEVSDKNQKTIAELLHEKKQEENTSESIEETNKN